MYEITSRVDQIELAVGDWIDQLSGYSMSQLLAKPDPSSWSLGQLYMHLIEATQFFIRQAHIAAASDDNTGEDAYVEAVRMFTTDEFPDALLEGPPSNALTLQPTCEEELRKGLEKLKSELSKARDRVRQSEFKGKAKHFGLGYFTAPQWLQFAEMHMRHHLRQKKRLDEFLKHNNIK